MTTQLEPRFDSRASFYGKARIEHDPYGGIMLISYSTKVAYIYKSQAWVYGTYSMTTLRHIKEFLRQNDFKAESSKQIMADYGNTITGGLK